MDELKTADEELFSVKDLEKDLKKGRGGRRWLWFLIGSVAGIVGTMATPIFLAPYLPSFLSGSRVQLSGPVLAEERAEDRLLLTIATEPGALIASFSKQVDEIALLVDPGDIVTIAVPDYEPFVENPDFKGIKKGSPSDGSGSGAPEERSDDAADAAGGGVDTDAVTEEPEAVPVAPPDSASSTSGA